METHVTARIGKVESGILSLGRACRDEGCTLFWGSYRAKPRFWNSKGEEIRVWTDQHVPFFDPDMPTIPSTRGTVFSMKEDGEGGVSIDDMEETAMDTKEGKARAHEQDNRDSPDTGGQRPPGSLLGSCSPMAPQPRQPSLLREGRSKWQARSCSSMAQLAGSCSPKPTMAPMLCKRHLGIFLLICRRKRTALPAKWQK